MKNEAENMTAEREGKILEDAINTWGAKAQIVKAMEEMAELIHALSRRLLSMWLSTGSDIAVPENVREEMADVNIMLNQLELIFGDTTEEEIRKLLRLEARIAAQKKAKEQGE